MIRLSFAVERKKKEMRCTLSNVNLILRVQHQTIDICEYAAKNMKLEKENLILFDVDNLTNGFNNNKIIIIRHEMLATYRPKRQMECCVDFTTGLLLPLDVYPNVI